MAKTEFMVMGLQQRLATFDRLELAVTVNDVPIKQVKFAKNLRMALYEKNIWINHVDKIVRKVSSRIGALKRIRGLIN